MNILQSLSDAAYSFTAYLFPPAAQEQKTKRDHPHTVTANMLLTQAWAKTMQQAQQTTVEAPAKPAFDEEDRLLSAHLSGKDTNSKALMRFANALKSSAYRTPYTKEERDAIKREEMSLVSTLNNGVETTVQENIDDLPETLKDLKAKIDSQLEQLVADVEKKRQEHIIAGPIDPHAIDLAKERIAKLIFLADRNPESTAALVDQKNPNLSSSSDSDPFTTAVKNLETAFDKEIVNINNNINANVNKHIKFKYQNSDAVAFTITPIEIAKVLMTSGGLLNSGLIDSVKKSFFGPAETLFEHQRDMLTTLDDLKKKPGLVKTLENITKPVNAESNANNIIRITLRLPSDALPTDTHAKITALSALLSDMRQGSVGSCFATSICIDVMGSLKEKVLSDFSEILSKGKVTRQSATDQSEFIPVLDIGDSTCQAAIDVSKDGSVKALNCMVWDSPGLQSACRQLGIPDGQINGAILDALKTLYSQNNIADGRPITTSMEDIIGAIGDKQNAALSIGAYQKQERIDLALTAFNAETNASLLRAYESCVASMAEAKDDGFVLGRMVNSVCQALFNKPVTPSYGNYTPSTPQDITMKVQEIFKKALRGSTQIRYDEKENIEKDSSQSATTGDGHSTEAGAFVTYRKLVGKDSTSAVKVTNPDDFKNFIADTIQVTKEVVFNLADNDAQRQKYQQEIDRINALVTGPNSTFLKTSIMNFNPNIKDPDPVRNWKKIEEVPWRDATGNFNKPIFNKLTGIDAGEASSVRPTTALQLGVSVINFGRDLERSNHFLENDLPDEKTSVNTNCHAFLLSLENDTIKDAIKITDPLVDPKDWLQKRIIDPSKKFKDFKLTPQQVGNLGAISRSIFLPKEMGSYFDSQFKQQIVNANITDVFSVSQAILKLAYSMTSQITDHKKDWIISSLTSILLDNILAPEVRNELGKNAVLIADTNWVDKTQKNIYFGLFYNPVTDKLELGNVNEDGTGLRGISQTDWVTGTNWDMFKTELTPEAEEAASLHPVA